MLKSDSKMGRFARSTLIASALAISATLSVPFAIADDDQPEVAAVMEEQVNINTANADMLALALDGVGMTRALDIIAYREEHGHFKTVDELERVRGIGKATLERNRHKILVKDESE
ncbi:ComEA family DNA-binding protein [Pseudohongiella spirulinae]|uniref:Competence protein ComEA helix-hairpin-helix region n=1 Tax=Pseudohongiella spirulinae TaxID=1249552 RepID=A0A0S2KDA5_9GAMM|nr:ComEA family DNA-binding protein [Pseudohongiella spirulinae]ALO46280.1 Competence protein ComEA helix-hairpin-helix region [Pseudohongiella spirulinae]